MDTNHASTVTLAAHVRRGLTTLVFLQCVSGFVRDGKNQNCMTAQNSLLELTDALLAQGRAYVYVKLQKIPRVVRGKILRDHSHV